MSDPMQKVCAEKAVDALRAIQEVCKQRGVGISEEIVWIYCAERITFAAEQIMYAVQRS
ncbi:MAG TPA: hypothetical protein VN325_33440 [Steroidobacteraceae bacterium]|nr:hypothetical protein [Steroidobacteraceae bacterium]